MRKNEYLKAPSFHRDLGNIPSENSTGAKMAGLNPGSGNSAGSIFRHNYQNSNESVSGARGDCSSF